MKLRGRRRGHSMDPDLALTEVRGLRRTADDLFTEFDRAVQAPRTRPSTDVETERFVASVLVMPILRALAAEIALKVISFKRSGTHLKTHDLRELYDNLDVGTRSLIEQTVKEQEGVWDKIEDILTAHRNDFVDWRYIGEGGDGNSDPTDLRKAVDILLSVCDGIRPQGAPTGSMMTERQIAGPDPRLGIRAERVGIEPM